MTSSSVLLQRRRVRVFSSSIYASDTEIVWQSSRRTLRSRQSRHARSRLPFASSFLVSLRSTLSQKAPSPSPRFVFRCLDRPYSNSDTSRCSSRAQEPSKRLSVTWSWVACVCRRCGGRVLRTRSMREGFRGCLDVVVSLSMRLRA